AGGALCAAHRYLGDGVAGGIYQYPDGSLNARFAAGLRGYLYAVSQARNAAKHCHWRTCRGSATLARLDCSPRRDARAAITFSVDNVCLERTPILVTDA